MSTKRNTSVSPRERRRGVHHRRGFGGGNDRNGHPDRKRVSIGRRIDETRPDEHCDHRTTGCPSPSRSLRTGRWLTAPPPMARENRCVGQWKVATISGAGEIDSPNRRDEYGHHREPLERDRVTTKRTTASGTTRTTLSRWATAPRVHRLIPGDHQGHLRHPRDRVAVDPITVRHPYLSTLHCPGEPGAETIGWEASTVDRGTIEIYRRSA